MTSKLRWELKRRFDKHIEEEEEYKPTQTEQELSDRLEGESRLVYNSVANTLDMSKRRVIDLQENTRFLLPKALNPLEEAKIDLRVETYRKTYLKYREENCGSKGGKKTNLTSSQKLGINFR